MELVLEIGKRYKALIYIGDVIIKLEEIESLEDLPNFLSGFEIEKIRFLVVPDIVNSLKHTDLDLGEVIQKDDISFKLFNGDKDLSFVSPYLTNNIMKDICSGLGVEKYEVVSKFDSICHALCDGTVVGNYDDNHIYFMSVKEGKRTNFMIPIDASYMNFMRFSNNNGGNPKTEYSISINNKLENKFKNIDKIYIDGCKIPETFSDILRASVAPMEIISYVLVNEKLTRTGFKVRKKTVKLADSLVSTLSVSAMLALGVISFFNTNLEASTLYLDNKYKEITTLVEPMESKIDYYSSYIENMNVSDFPDKELLKGLNSIEFDGILGEAVIDGSDIWVMVYLGNEDAIIDYKNELGNYFKVNEVVKEETLESNDTTVYKYIFKGVLQ